MSKWITPALILAVAIGWTSSARADECQPLIEKLTAGVPNLEIGQRTSADQSTIVKLKHPDTAAMSLICHNAAPQAPIEFSAKCNATWPPATFYDLVASVGAIVASSTEPAIRSGAVLCAQRALTSADSSAAYDVNGVHFECTTTTGIGQATNIRISKLDVQAPPAPQ